MLSVGANSAVNEAGGSYRVSLFTASAVVVAAMVGTGVYTSLGFQLEYLSSGFSIIMLWLIGGILALCGAMSYAELAALFPRSGGEYNLLSKIYHPSLGFAAGLISLSVGFPAPVALAAIALGRYAHAVAPVIAPSYYSYIAVCLATLAHYFNLRAGSRVQNCITSASVVLIVVLIVTAFAFGSYQGASFLPLPGDFAAMMSAPFAVSLMYVMYAYSGWNASVYIAGEISDPGRTIMRSVLLGTWLVTLMYIGLNVAFLYVSPIGDIRGHLEVAQIAGAFLFGSIGSRAVSFIIVVGLFGCISSMTWIGSRVAQTMGEDIRSLSFLSLLTKGGIPGRALALQFAIVMIMVAVGSFQSILLAAESALLLSSLLCVIGVIVLRITHPDVERPWKCPLVPITPLLFALMTLFMLIRTVEERPYEALSGLGLSLFFVALYFLGAKERRA